MKPVLESVGAEAEDEKIEKLIADLEGKNVEELIKEGLEKLVSIPAAGAAAAAPAAAAAAAPHTKRKAPGVVYPRRSVARYSLSRIASMIQALTLWPAAAAAALIWSSVAPSVPSLRILK